MWDNRAVLHAVIGDVGGAERSLHRVAVAGDEQPAEDLSDLADH